MAKVEKAASAAKVASTEIQAFTPDFSNAENIEVIDSGEMIFCKLYEDGKYFRGVFAGLPNSEKVTGLNFVLTEDFTTEDGEMLAAGSLITAPNYHALRTHFNTVLDDENIQDYVYHVERLNEKDLGNSRSVMQLKILRVKRA